VHGPLIFKESLQGDGRQREFSVLVGYNSMGHVLVREPVQRLIVQDLCLWWKSKSLAYF